MSFLNRPKDYTAESLLKAEDVVAYRARLNRMPKIHSPQGALFCVVRGMPHRLRWRIPVRAAGSMNADLHETTRTKNPVVIVTNFGSGSPIVAEIAEELAVMGIPKMILMMPGGSLQPDLNYGDAVVCTQAIRDEGTSHHYLPPAKYVDADAALGEKLSRAIQSRGVRCTSGVTWTTDAPYRETLADVQYYQSEGVKTVEMEAAGLLTVGCVRRIPTVAVTVVMDSLAEQRWQVPDKPEAVQRSLELVYAAAIEVLSES